MLLIAKFRLSVPPIFHPRNRCLTRRAPEPRQSAPGLAWLGVGSAKMELSCPAHQWVTPAVGRFKSVKQVKKQVLMKEENIMKSNDNSKNSHKKIATRIFAAITKGVSAGIVTLLFFLFLQFAEVLGDWLLYLGGLIAIIVVIVLALRIYKNKKRENLVHSFYEESIEDFSKLTYRQRFAITEYGYLLSPENAEVVGKMLGNSQDEEILPFCQANGKKVSVEK